MLTHIKEVQREEKIPKMKINEKTLISYASSSAPCDREGWLLKRGEVNRAFQRRWCVLRGNLLFYSANQGDREPLGVIILEGCTVELAEEETEVYAFKIQFHGDGKTMGRTYSLGTQTMEDLEQWMKLVACASFDYMKLMVVEMQQQLNELEDRERIGGGEGGDPKPPPRGRANPFNSGGEQGRKVRKGWREVHIAAGRRVQEDRGKWLRNKEENKKTEIHMEEDTLLVVI